MARIDKGHHFLSGFGNEDYLEDYFSETGMDVKPSANISENDKRYKLEMGLPGVRKDEVKIELIDHELLISGHKENVTDTENEGYSRREFNYNDFKRTFIIPKNVDIENINAGFNDGMLEITLPKKGKTEEHQPIEIHLS